METLARRVERARPTPFCCAFPTYRVGCWASEWPAYPKTLNEAVVGHYGHAGAWEQHVSDRRITDQEPIRNFERA